jgi:hypothetical protein
MTETESPPDDPARQPATGPGAHARRAEAMRRRAEALRENLKRRKAQARGRKAAQAEAGPDKDDAAPAQES